MALPANVGFGTVVGRFIDSEGNPITGQFTFTPTPDNLKNVTAAPPVTILPKAITALLDPSGDISVTLVATNDPDNNPSGWTYRVTFSSSVAKIEPFSISVPEGSTQDLAVIMPVASSQGDAIVRGPGVAMGGTTGQVLGKASDLDAETEWIDLDATRTAFASTTGLTADTVAEALDELAVEKITAADLTPLDTRVDSAESDITGLDQRVTTVEGDVAAIDATTVPFTSTTGLTATTVGAALDELDASKADQIAVTDLDTRVTDLEAVDPPPSQRVRLTADFTGTASNTAFEDVSGMAITLGANEEWDFEILLHVSGSEAADIEFAFTGPAGVSVFMVRAFGLPGGAGGIGGGARPVSMVGIGDVTGKMGLVDAGPVPVEFKGTIVNGGTSGSLQLRAAQSVADPIAHVIKAGSTFTAVQVA